MLLPFEAVSHGYPLRCLQVGSYVVYGISKLECFKNQRKRSKNYFLSNLGAQALEFRSCTRIFLAGGNI